MSDVSREKWFKTFVANNETALKNFFRQGATYIKIIGIKPDTQNKATEEEWSHLEKALERGIREGLFAAVDANYAAASVLSMVHGLGFQTALDVEGRLPVPPEVVAEQVLRGLRAPNITSLEFSSHQDKSNAPN